MNLDDINNYIPSLLNPRGVRKENGGVSLTQNSYASRCSLSLRRSNILHQQFKAKDKIRNNSNNIHSINKNSIQNTRNYTKPSKHKHTIDSESIGFSAISDLQSVINDDFDTPSQVKEINAEVAEIPQADCSLVELSVPVSSNTELDQSYNTQTDSTIYNVDERATIAVSFGVNRCQNIDINSKKSNIKRVLVSQRDENTLVDCEIHENNHLTPESDLAECVKKEPQIKDSLKGSDITVNLEIKKKRLSEQTEETSKVLILKTNAIEKISHVIVQPPNYRTVKRNILKPIQIRNVPKRKSYPKLKSALQSNFNNESVSCGRLRQNSIDSYFCGRAKVVKDTNDSLGGPQLVTAGAINNGRVWAMNKNSGVDKNGRRSPCFGRCADNDGSLRQSRALSSVKVGSPDRVASPQGKIERSNSHSPRKHVESLQFNIPPKSASTKKSITVTKPVPHYKIIAGTHFAVDAFSYDEIQNVKHYFLTHFHSDHYCGLKKTFNKMLFCSKITADLCMSRLGVNPRFIHIINVDETIKVDGIEVTAVEANHCPGALMLVFTLPNGKTLLHTGDFRATPQMESYPVFWNKDIHTIYLDTTYCNARYDFPTQEQSLEMALYILRQKKLDLEKVGKKFSSVLIVCGTYTIGKEKFFLGMARRVGCSVWACPEKDRVLQTVEGRSFGRAPPQSCQLHVVPMRDLTHEKLRAYLDSLRGTFNEVVAFKPSGWENGKSPSVEKDMVTIHGIPYSEHSSFSELIRFVKYLKPKQVVPTVDISGGVKSVQKYFPCPLVSREDSCSQSKLMDFFSIQKQQQVSAVT